MIIAPGWVFAVEVSESAAEIFERALAPICSATSIFKASKSNLSRVEALAIKRPDPAAVVSAIALATKLSGVPEPEIFISSLPLVDWLEQNQRSFKPLVVGRFFIHASHFSEKPPYGSNTLTINAGQAFGTGAHGSTLGCLLALDQLSYKLPKGKILDLGCGTGILALSIARRWQRRVFAADIDPQALAVTKMNARLNCLSHFVKPILTNGFKNSTIRENGPYGLIVANILARPLVKMQRDVKYAIKPGGKLILSGFTRNHRNWIRSAYQARYFRLIRTINSEDWTTLVLTRKGQNDRYDVN